MAIKVKDDTALTDDQRNAGYYLVEDEDFLYLKQMPGRDVARFNSRQVLPEYVRDICQRDIEKRRG